MFALTHDAYTPKTRFSSLVLYFFEQALDRLKDAWLVTIGWAACSAIIIGGRASSTQLCFLIILMCGRVFLAFEVYMHACGACWRSTTGGQTEMVRMGGFVVA